MSSKPTKNQQDVIDQKNSNILVSASAGSGKTTTMINRVLRIIDDGISIDRLVIITFTKASAADMRDKLEKSLLNAAKDAAEDKKRFLESQILKLPSSIISTIDSFAQSIVEQYYDVVAVNPKFRLIEGGENELLKEEAFDLTIKSFYQEKNQSFVELIKNFDNLNNITQFKQAVYKISDFTRARFDGSEWLKNLSSRYTEEFLDEFFWKYIDNKLSYSLGRMVSDLKIAIDLTESSEEKNAKEYNQIITEQMQLLLSIKIRKYDDTRDRINEVSSALNNELSIVRKRPTQEELKEAKQLTKKVRDDFNQIVNTFFPLSGENLSFIHQQSEKLIETLVSFINRYHQNLETKKSADGLLDFADIELNAYQILQNENVRIDLQNRFYEVLVDEYQDVNRLQDEIVSLITNGSNRFMVGDIKQSIYGFRQASPDLFVNYFEKYLFDEDGTMISLSENFRSGSNILLAINQIFKQIMSRDFGGIDYRGAAELVPGLLQVGNDKESKVQLKIIHEKFQQKTDSTLDIVNDNVHEEDINENYQIAELINTINQLTSQGINYSEIAILTRTKSSFERIITDLNNQNIPVVSTTATNNYFNRFEISTIMSYLQIIDNPLIDIPLVAVLRSPIFNLTSDELVELSQIEDDQTFYYFDYINSYLEQGTNPVLKKKLKKFIESLKKYQQLANQNLISELIFEIYKDTGWVEYVAGLSDGIQRQANLQAFFQYSQSFQETSFIGLHYFMSYINSLIDVDEDLESAKVTTTDSAVSLMTIHGSKGLEFKAVIMLELNKRFNFQDSTAPILIDGELGIGIDFVNPISNVKISTWPRLKIKSNIIANTIAEQMRLLYVALTRAEEQLILIGTKKDTLSKQFSLSEYQSFIQALDLSEDEFLPSFLIEDFGNFLDMILYALMAAQSKNEKLLVEILEIDPEETYESKQSSGTANQSVEINPNELEKIKDLAYLNLENELSIVPAFLSVSELKRIKEDPDNTELSEHSTLNKITELPEPKFFNQNGSVAANKIGSAVHAILERIDYQNEINQKTIDEIVNQLSVENIFDENIADAINKEQLIAFFETDFAKQIINHEESLRREESFAMLVPSNQLAETDSEKPILVKGTIDGYYLNEADKSITVFDYKTNSIKNGVDKIIDLYTNQITWYSKALESMYPGYKVKNKILIILADINNQIHYL